MPDKIVSAPAKPELASYFVNQAGKHRNKHEITVHVSSGGVVTIQIGPQGGDGSDVLTFTVQGNSCLPG